MQGIHIDEYEIKGDQIQGSLPFTPTLEGTSMIPDGIGSTSSRSDGSEFEQTEKLNLSTPCNFPSRRSFMAKPIHPLSFPIHPQRESHRLSSGSSSIDFTDVSEQYDPDFLSRASNPPNESSKCGLCERLLSQRSPWSSRRIVRNGDFPTTGVLSCCHIFHAECLDQTTTKSQKSDPPCPVCSKLVERENSPEQHVFPRLRNTFPRLRTFSEEGPSRSWGCVQASDCVEGALNSPQRGTMFLLNMNQMKKNKGNSSKEIPVKTKKYHPLHFFGGRSKIEGSPSMKK